MNAGLRLRAPTLTVLADVVKLTVVIKLLVVVGVEVEVHTGNDDVCGVVTVEVVPRDWNWTGLDKIRDEWCVDDEKEHSLLLWSAILVTSLDKIFPSDCIMLHGIIESVGMLLTHVELADIAKVVSIEFEDDVAVQDTDDVNADTDDTNEGSKIVVFVVVVIEQFIHNHSCLGVDININGWWHNWWYNEPHLMHSTSTFAFNVLLSGSNCGCCDRRPHTRHTRSATRLAANKRALLLLVVLKVELSWLDFVNAPITVTTEEEEIDGGCGDTDDTVGIYVLVVVVFTVGGFITFPVAICLFSVKGRVTATVLAEVVVLIAKEGKIDAVSLSVNVRSIDSIDNALSNWFKDCCAVLFFETTGVFDVELLLDVDEATSKILKNATLLRLFARFIVGFEFMVVPITGEVGMPEVLLLLVVVVELISWSGLEVDVVVYIEFPLLFVFIELIESFVTILLVVVVQMDEDEDLLGSFTDCATRVRCVEWVEVDASRSFDS